MSWVFVIISIIMILTVSWVGNILVKKENNIKQWCVSHNYEVWSPSSRSYPVCLDNGKIVIPKI